MRVEQRAFNEKTKGKGTGAKGKRTVEGEIDTRHPEIRIENERLLRGIEGKNS